jgi:hypothetical protein
VAQRYGLHFVGGSHFEVQGQRERIHQSFDIRVCDVASILAQMRGYTVSACRFSQLRGPHRVRICSAPRVSHGRNVVNVYAQTQASKWFLHRILRPLLSHDIAL